VLKSGCHNLVSEQRSDDLLGCGVLVLGRITLSGGVFVTPGPEQLWLRHFLIQGIS